MYVWVAVGSEILQGSTIDTNLQRLAEAVGGPASFSMCVCDSLSSLVEAFEYVTSWSEKQRKETSVRVVVCGGLGPTSDDLTLEGFSAWSGLKLAEVEELVEKFSKSSPEFCQSQSLLKQALVPESFTFIENEIGTAPLIWGDYRGIRWFFIPGVPAEFDWFVKHQEFRAAFGCEKSEVRLKIQVFFQGEASVFNAVRHVTDEFSDDIGFYPKNGVVDIVVKGEDEDTARHRSELIQLALREAGMRFLADKNDLSLVAHDLILERELTVSVVESFTGGRLASDLTRHPGSSKYFKGGIVAYSVEAKRRLLGVDVDNPVSADVACELAKSCQATFSTDLAISTTGVAGPGPDEWGNREGLMFIGISMGQAVEAVSMVLKAGRARVIDNGVRLALLTLLEKLKP